MNATPGKRPRMMRLAVGISITAIFLYATFRTIPLRDVGQALAGARVEWIAATAGCIVLAYLLKILRWTTMLRNLGARVGLRDTAPPFLGGVAFNNVLPLRAGDLIRVVAFQRYTGVPPSGQLGTLALERLMDLLVLCGILFATLSFWPADILGETMLAGLRLVALGAVAAVILFIAAPWPIRIAVRMLESRIPRLQPAGDALLRLSDAVAALSRPLFLARILALSLAAWLAEGAAYYMVGLALGLGGNVQIALLALSIGTLATMIPSSPGYVGTFHFFVARVVAAFSGGGALAAAYAVLIHAMLWVMTTTTGFIAITRSKRHRDVPPTIQGFQS